MAELERQEETTNKKGYLPWIIGGGVILGLVVVIIHFLTRNKKKSL